VFCLGSSVQTCKIKHFTTFTRPSHKKPTTLEHFCKCFKYVFYTS